jgi:peptidoglycan/LPS O-acetylase OafA/YrhL
MNGNTKEKERFAQLDSLRGLAALIVVLYHFSIVPAQQNGRLWSILLQTPLRVVISGTQSVVFFFVLSGFVLSLSFYSDKPPTYGTYLLKRVCRLYIPYAIAISIAILARLLFSRGGISGLSGWFNAEWTTPITPGLVLKHLMLVLNFNNYAFDGVVWSLIHEMRISIIFPALMLMIIRVNWKWCIVLGVLLSMVGLLFQHHYHSGLQPWYKTLPYIFTFMVGAYVAKYREFLVRKYRQIPSLLRALLLLSGILLFGSTQWIKASGTLDDFETIAGAVILIVAALSAGTFTRILMLRPIKFLGKISYSLYLYHIIVLLAFLNLFYGKVTLPIILGATLVSSIFIASIAWWAIERPSIQLGRRVTYKHPGETQTKIVSLSETN